MSFTLVIKVERTIAFLHLCATTVFPNGFYNTTVYWGKEYGKTGHSNIFTFFWHFMIILKHNIFLGKHC